MYYIENVFVAYQTMIIKFDNFSFYKIHHFELQQKNNKRNNYESNYIILILMNEKFKNSQNIILMVL
jgi:hypothetical protein